MPKEIATFIRYGKEKGDVVAVFYDRAMQEYFELTKKECEERLKNAKEKGHLYDQTNAALNGWPEN